MSTHAEGILWDLSDLYSGVDDPGIDRDLDKADIEAKALAERSRGRIGELDPGGMDELLKAYEAVLDTAWKPRIFAYLHWSTDTEDTHRGALLQKTTERNSRLTQELLFLELEWAGVPEKTAAALIQDSRLEHYRHWLTTTRRYRPHLLSEPEERILNEKSLVGRNAWVRFFDEIHAAARYQWEGGSIPSQSILTKLYHSDRTIRKKAAASFTRGLAEISRTTTYVFNCILGDKDSDDRLRSYPNWISARHLDNQVDDSTVEALIQAVTGRYDIVARYYGLKAGLLGVDELFDYDRYAPLPASEKEYTWDEAGNMVLDAYGRFHEKMGLTAKMFFDRRWIDAFSRPGKTGGAYSHSTVPSVHPYVFLNYEGNSRDVMTLAHELGHGVHQMLSKDQGILQADTPLTTAETASVFGEMLVFQDLMAREEDPKARLSMLVGKIEDSFATVFRQVAMNRFEDGIHEHRRKKGELSAEDFTAHWMKTQREMFQGSVTLTDDYGTWWSYIPHFIGTPGYVYAYAFGELLVLALFRRYEEMGPGFADLYIDMLSAGGSSWPHELVAPLGVDLKDPGFWSGGLEELEKLVIQAEELAENVNSR